MNHTGPPLGAAARLAGPRGLDALHVGQVRVRYTVRPMMYVALSYDHRIVDGAEAVGFLVHIKNAIENPERMLLGL